ncbi:hypothetical protein MNBD_GAMMA12-3375 [hydrothermal vent metagenome]|uniref:Uncharacterized protein n=1 Tax=hydrothermal vent metagenome TaxID=652676 RepID=A0A3B0YYI3_9ZZZZ
MNKEKLIKGALAGLVAAGVSLASTQTVAAKKGFEKCAGIVKTGMNGCGNTRHGCKGKAAKDSMADEWLYVPTGTCNKIVGAKLFVKKK